ncbi:hypothetical protein SLEP1_g16839 [Rubroshorea leprosula]|uniref:Cytochrome P450 n=1 Tax=Rubroshorea leprosula TaxID=152421 RepID=A0AAV5J123_9ROSI|nr:hypothetical protein SLEP1_g16839 [Rubroshorea leprosula]
MDFNFLFSNLNGTFAAVFAICLFSCFLLRRSRKAYKGQKLPDAPGSWPLIGHLHLLTGPELPHIRLGALADKYGPIFNIQIGIHPTLVVSSWEVAKEIFTVYNATASSRPKLAVGKYLGYNYVQFGFAPYGAYWRETRKITALELLSNRRLELLRHVRASEVEGSIKELYKLWIKRRSEATHVLVEMKQWFGDLNLNVFLRMVAGIRYSGAREAADEKEVRRCRKAMREWFHLAGLFVVRDAIPFLGWLDLGGYREGHEENCRRARWYSGEVVGGASPQKEGRERRSRLHRRLAPCPWG